MIYDSIHKRTASLWATILHYFYNVNTYKKKDKERRI